MSRKRSIEALKKRLDKHQRALADQRDQLRELIWSIEEIEQDTDRAIEALEEAIDALSRLQ